MPRLALVYRGWVGAKEIDRIELEAMGVDIRSNWNPIGAFDRVRMTADVYRVFRERWKGRYVWGLIGKMEEVPTPTEIAAAQKDEDDIPF